MSTSGGIRELLAKNLRHYRTQQGLSQEALALKSGIHKTTLSLIECGRMGATVDMVERIAHHLQIAPAVFFSESPVENPAPLRGGRKRGTKNQRLAPQDPPTSSTTYVQPAPVDGPGPLTH